ncbi:hypothetical protein KKA15_04905 [Patescibacteria group bacterium]|nr:hypothetical protein [Patescibacteria group bacterium]
MLESSKDLLLIVIAFCVLWLTLFMSWGIYYVVMMLRNTNKVMTSIREKMVLVDSILKLVKEKLEKTSSHMGMMADSAIKLAGYFVEQKKKSSSSTSRSKKKKS